MTRCSQCKRKFDNLNLHLDLAHSNRREKWCKHCGRLFSKKSHLKMHLDTNQCDGTGHRCYVCDDENFNSVESFSCHLETHDSLHVYACKDCKRTFMLRNNYNEHVSLVHDTMIVSVDELLEGAINCTLGDDYSSLFLDSSIEKGEGSDDYCIQCRRCFPQIKIHRALAHCDKPQIICHLCGRQFLKMKRLELHSSEHLRDTIECHVCDRSDFVDSKSFCRHLEEHESLRVLPCSLCSKIFALKLNLDKHVRKKHKDFQVVDDKSECTVSKSNENNCTQEAYLPEDSHCRIQFLESTKVQENLTSPKKKKRKRENSFTNSGNQEINVSRYSSLSCGIVKEEPKYLEEHISVKEEKKKRLYREISSSPKRKRKNSSSLSIVKEDEDPYQLSERSGNEESFVRLKKKKKKDDKENLLSVINRSSENVISLLESDEEEQLSLFKKNKKNKSDKENSLSPIKKNPDNVVISSECDKEDTFNQTKKNKKNDKQTLLSPINLSSDNVASLLESDEEESLSLFKKNKSDKAYSSGLMEKTSSAILSFGSDNEESSSLGKRNTKSKSAEEVSSGLVEKNRRNKNDIEKDICDKYSWNTLKNKHAKSSDTTNLGDKLFDSRKLREPKKCLKNQGTDERNSRISDDEESDEDCLSDTSQSSVVDKTCFECGDTFPNRADVYTHYIREHNNLSMSCQKCDKEIKTSFNVYCHAMKHSNAYPWKCKRCDVSLKTKTYYRRHMRRVHLLQKKYKCPHCYEVFIYHSPFVAHVMLHEDEAQFTCTFCNKLFRYKKFINPHQEEIDCKECAITFPCKTLFDQHLLDKHSHESLFDCPHCHNQYHSRGVLRRHITNKHFDLMCKDPVYCHICSYFTNSMHNLNRHVRTKHR